MEPLAVDGHARRPTAALRAPRDSSSNEPSSPAKRTRAASGWGNAPPPTILVAYAACRPAADAEPLAQLVEGAVRHAVGERERHVPLVGERPPELSRAAAYGQEVVEVLDGVSGGTTATNIRRHWKPRSRPISIFMISLDPAQIFVTRASRQARATRYSFM